MRPLKPAFCVPFAYGFAGSHPSTWQRCIDDFDDVHYIQVPYIHMLVRPGRSSHNDWSRNWRCDRDSHASRDHDGCACPLPYNNPLLIVLSFPHGIYIEGDSKRQGSRK